MMNTIKLSRPKNPYGNNETGKQEYKKLSETKYFEIMASDEIKDKIIKKIYKSDIAKAKDKKKQAVI